MIETDLVARITSDSAITAVIGARVYPWRPPENATKPYITYQCAAEDHNRHLLGPSGLVRAAYQFDCWAVTHLAARTLANLLRLRLDNYTSSTGTHEIQRIKLTNALDNWEFQTGGTEDIYGRVTQIYDVWHAVTVPS